MMSHQDIIAQMMQIILASFSTNGVVTHSGQHNLSQMLLPKLHFNQENIFQLCKSTN